MAPDVAEMEGMYTLSQDEICMADLAAQAPAAHYVAQVAGMDTLNPDEICMADMAARGRWSPVGHGSAAAMERCEDGPSAASSTSTGTHLT